MARSTVIDSLLVVLGLDSTPYKKGEQDAEKSQKRLRDNTKKTSDEMSAAIKGVARQIAVLVLGFESIKGGISFLAGVNDADAALGRLAKDAGVSVHELNTWGLAVHDIGGDAKEAQAAVAGLSKELSVAKTSGELGPLLSFFQRIGVALQDSNGKARNMLELLDEAGKQMRARDRTTMVNLAQQAGLGESLTRLLLTEDAARKGIFATAEKNNSLTEAGALNAAKMQAEWRSLVDAAEDFARTINQAIFPAVMSFFHALEPIKPLLVDIINSLKNAGAFEGLANGITHTVEALRLAIDGWIKLIGLLPKGGEQIANVVEAINAPKGPSNEGVLERIKNVFSTPEEVTRRRNVAHIRETEGVGAAARYLMEQDKIQAARASGYAPGQGAAAGTNVQIDSITVNTQATDAQGVAAELPNALRRKGVVAQADSGMN